jgi:isopenicillin N synthase-like dioxygenase
MTTALPTGADAGAKSAVPVVDIAPYLHGSAEDRARVAAEVKRTCSEVGFFVLTGHGVDPRLMEQMRLVSAGFFDLPEQEKLRYASDPGTTMGYVPMGRENLAATLGKRRPADVKEIFDICRPDLPADEYYTSPMGQRFFRPYPWPDRPEQFREVWTQYYRAMERLAADIMRLFAEALGLPADYFADKTDRSVDYLRVINYPAQVEAPAAGQLRAGEHTDYGTLTLVATEDAPGGLQVRTPAGEWADVPHVTGGLVVNIGDMMAQWTNDVWVSTLHRVANPEAGRATSRRQSIVFFQNPNYDTLIKPLATCVSQDNPPRYEVTPAGKWLVDKATRQRA